GSDFLQKDSKASSAVFIAFSASSLFALDTYPIISSLFAGLTDTILSSVVIRSPPIISGYSLPRSASTFLSASSIACLFSSTVKSVKGSCLYATTIKKQPPNLNNTTHFPYQKEKRWNISTPH